MLYRASLRSTNQGDWIVPSTRTTSIGYRSFTFSAPVIQNTLQVHLHSSFISRRQCPGGLIKQAYVL